jgi:DnaK suppressor protein
MPLRPHQIEELRDELLRVRRRLARSLAISDESSRPVTLDQASIGRLSRIDAIQNQQMSQGLEAREHARYAQVEAALARIEQGRYGACDVCERDIPFELAGRLPRDAGMRRMHRPDMKPASRRIRPSDHAPPHADGPSI